MTHVYVFFYLWKNDKTISRVRAVLNGRMTRPFSLFFSLSPSHTGSACMRMTRFCFLPQFLRLCLLFLCLILSIVFDCLIGLRNRWNVAFFPCLLYSRFTSLLVLAGIQKERIPNFWIWIKNKFNGDFQGSGLLIRKFATLLRPIEVDKAIWLADRTHMT